MSSSTPAQTVPAPGYDELKPPPDLAWQQQAIATLQRYTSITIVDRTSAPQPINSIECQEIYQHLLDKVTSDGHSGFRALSKSITGTESNHTAIRAAVVTFMQHSCAGRRRPWIVSAKSIDDNITLSHMDTTGWLSDNELQFMASLLQIPIYVFATLHGRRRTRRWIPYNPAFKTDACMPQTPDYNLHLRHNVVRDHFDRVVFNR